MNILKIYKVSEEQLQKIGMGRKFDSQDLEPPEAKPHIRRLTQARLDNLRR